MMRHLPHRAAFVALALILAGLLQGCSPPPTLRIGFIGTLSNRASDVGEAGRNGVILAIEQRNARGGVKGRAVDLQVEDDGQSAHQATEAFRALRGRQVEAIIGPFTSAMAATLVPLTNEARLVMISPTVTSMDFHGKDDHFIRIHRTTRDNAADYARRLYARGQRRLAVAYDLSNRSFSLSWLHEFHKAYTALGGRLAAEVPFESGANPSYGDIARNLLGGPSDGLLFIANAVDSARLGQRARQLQPQVPMATAEWAASETLLEMGGGSIEGMLVLQPYDREDTSPRYTAFRAAYQERFQREPGYSAVAGYDAATVLLDALERRPEDSDLKAALLAGGPYQGLQQAIAFDANGDTERRIVFNEVHNGRFVPAR